MWSQIVRRLDDSLLLLAEGGGAGKEGPVLLFLSSPFRLDSYSGRGLAGRTAAAGSRWNCWRSEECPAPLPSLVLCCRLCLTLAEDKTQA